MNRQAKQDNSNKISQKKVIVDITYSIQSFMKCLGQKFVTIFHVEKLSAIIALTFVPGQLVK